MKQSLRHDSVDHECSTYASIESVGVCFTEAHEPEHDYPGDIIAPPQNVRVTLKDAVPLCLWVLDQVHKDPLLDRSPHQLVAQIRGLEAQMWHSQSVRDANAKDLAAALDIKIEDPILPQLIKKAIRELSRLRARAIPPHLLWIAVNALEGDPPDENMRASIIKELSEAAKTLEKLNDETV